jgi:hypothetical protein
MKLPYARNRIDLPAGRDRASDPSLSCSTLVLQLIHPRVNRSATEASTMSNSGVLDTRFRSALERMALQGRLNAYTAPIDPHLEVAADEARWRTGAAVQRGRDVTCRGGNLVVVPGEYQAAFGIDFTHPQFRAGLSQPPVLVESAGSGTHPYRRYRSRRSCLRSTRPPTLAVTSPPES